MRKKTKQQFYYDNKDNTYWKTMQYDYTHSDEEYKRDRYSTKKKGTYDSIYNNKQDD